jgi:hypothetical protein
MLPGAIQRRFAAYSVEFVTVIELPDERSVCPVCGFINDFLWYRPGDVFHDRGDEVIFWLADTYFICADCRTEFGNTDIPALTRGETRQQAWHQLRMAWLQEVDWAPESVKQLGNLGFATEEVLSWRQDLD